MVWMGIIIKIVCRNILSLFQNSSNLSCHIKDEIVNDNKKEKKWLFFCWFYANKFVLKTHIILTILYKIIYFSDFQTLVYQISCWTWTFMWLLMIHIDIRYWEEDLVGERRRSRGSKEGDDRVFEEHGSRARRQTLLRRREYWICRCGVGSIHNMVLHVRDFWEL